MSAAQKRRQRRRGFLELGEHQHLLLPRGHGLGDLTQARKLAAGLGRPGAVAQPLRGMVADLLQSHQEREHQALALHALGLLQRLLQGV